MIKKVLFFLLLFSGTPLFAESSISSLKYQDYLNSDTLIELWGEELNTCKTLTLNQKNIPIQELSESKIIFKFSDLEKYTGTFFLECSDKKLSQSFKFPHIKSIHGLDDNNINKSITISGENFGDSANVVLNGGRFELQTATDRLIVGKVGAGITDPYIYLEVDGFKSNLYKLNVKVPKITHLYSKSNFSTNNEVTIYGENLNAYKDTVILLGEEKVTDFKRNVSQNSISFTPKEEHIGNKKIGILSNEFESNTIELNIYGESPIIERIYQEKGTDNEYFLVIKGRNFPKIKGDFTLHHNDSALSTSHVDSKEIIVKDYDLKWGDNDFYLKHGKIFSNTYNFKHTYRLPQIGGISIGSLEGDKRNILLSVNNFNEETDSIYFNNSIVRPLGCNVNLCRIQISKNIFSGEITVGRNGDKNILSKEFDISEQKQSSLKYLEIMGDIKAGAKVKIIGMNLKNGDIGHSNLLDSSSDITVSDDRVEGRIPLNYKKDRSSSFSIRSNGKTFDISFVGSTLTKNKVYATPYIDSIISLAENKLFQKGTKVQLIGTGFRPGYHAIVGKDKIPLKIIDSSNATFSLPSTINEGVNNISIEGEYSNTSDKKNIIIVPLSYTPKVYLQKANISNTTQNIGSSKYPPLYEISLINKIDEFHLDQLGFQVKNYDKEMYLGSFLLKINGEEVGKAFINSQGEILFSDIDYDIQAMNEEVKISLIKKSHYIKQNDIDINFSPDSVIILKKDSQDKISNIGLTAFSQNHISIIDEGFVNCIDLDSDDKNCNSFTSTAPQINQPKANNLNKLDLLRTMFIAKKNLEKTSKGRKYKAQIDIIIEKLSEKKLNNLYKKLDKIDTNLSKYKKIKDIIDYLKTKTGIKLLSFS